MPLIPKTLVRSAPGAALLALAVAMFTPAARAADRAPDGVWQGTLMGLRLVVHLERDSAGALRGRLDSPDQGAMGIPIDEVAFAGDSLRLELRRLQAGYTGRMSAGGDTLHGQWRQGGMMLDLALGRGGAAPELKRPQYPQGPLPYDTAAVVFDNPKAGIRLAGTLTVPRGAGPFPCALLITGSGPEDRDETVFGHRPFLVLADHLTRKGIAVLRVDDRGVGGSTGDHAAATSEDFASDVLAGIEFLKTHPAIDRRKIGLIGHSEGGLIAPMVAVRSKDVAFIVLMAGPGIPGDSLLILQSAEARRMLGVGEDALELERAASRRLYDAIRGNDTPRVVPLLRELIELQTAMLPEAQRRAVGNLDTLAARTSRQLLSPWMRFFLAFDPRPTLRQVKCPVLAINGSRDFQVTPKENLAGLRAAFAAGGNRRAIVKELPGLNHMFQTCRTCLLAEYSQLEETIAPAALEEISSWVLARFSGAR